jgi:Carboxypeptidase regulatory-like domain
MERRIDKLRQSSRQLVWALALTLVAAMPAFAQFERGRISGTIKDAQGGVMPGVTVTATNQQNQQAVSVTTDDSGFYNFANLTPGRYNMAAELQGFKKVVRNDVQLDAAGAINIDFDLQTGALTEEVTVTAEAAPLQTDVALRKTVESKDIEQMSFSGRNPIGVAGLKAGVIGGSFNSYGFASLSNGGYNINGSRGDENNITVDGATAIRTRSSGAAIGVQNVDAIQEVQVLTGNYMPEFGRASGGQIRMVTKSGGNRYSGSASYFLRDESLQANSWSRNRSTSTLENSGPAPFDFKQYGYSFGGPIPGSALKDKLFFFGAQEWVNFFQVQTAIITVPTEAMRRGDFSELLNANNGFMSARQIIDPQTGQPFPNNVIPESRLSPTGRAILNAYPLPTPGFRQGSNNAVITSPNPQDQRKDNIRLDYRLNNANQFTFRHSRYNWKAVDAFRGDLPFARTDWERPNHTTTATWTSTLSNSLINELTYTFSKDDVQINVFTEDGAHLRSTKGINYPYVFQEKEIFDKIPTVSITNFREMDGGPYPSSSSGPIHTIANTTTWVKGRHTFKAGLQFEYSGEDDFDQINVSAIPGSTNNQNGRFEFQDNRSAGTTGAAISNVALGLFTNYAELGQRNFTQWRALATDIFVQDSWKPTSALTIEGGFRYVYWPPWYSTTNNIANFDPRFYDPAQAAIINPQTGRLVGGARYNGIVLPGDGFEGDAANSPLASNPAILALFRGEPRGFSETHANVFEPRLGMSYALGDKTVLRASGGIFHNRVTLNDSTLLGGNPPFQPQVTIANGIADNPAGGTASSADLPFGINGQDPVFKHPTAYIYAIGMQREVPLGFVVDVTYVHRRGLYLQRERNINQLLPGTLQANPNINIAALRPYTGYGAIRVSENSGRSRYNSLQISADRRYSNGLKVGAAYTLGKSEDNGSDKRNVLWNTYDDTAYWGNSQFDRRHVLNFYYIYDLPFYRDQSQGLMSNLLGGWQISGATFFRTGTPFSVLRTNDIAGVGDGGNGQPVNFSGDIDAGANKEFSNAVNDGNYWFNVNAFSDPAPGTFGNAPRNFIYNPGEQQWDLAIFKNFTLGGTRRMQFRAEMFNFINHPNWDNVQLNSTLPGSQGYTDPTNAEFGRVTRKRSQARDIQLSLRFQF